jgi:hypothetical protein
MPKKFKSIEGVILNGSNSIYSNYFTIYGYPLEEISKESCQKICEENELCDYGYWVEDKKGKTLCFPLYSLNSKFNPNINLDNISNISENYKKSFYFYNNIKFPWWEDTNKIFYNDTFLFSMQGYFLDANAKLTKNINKGVKLSILKFDTKISSKSSYPVQNFDKIILITDKTFKALTFDEKVGFKFEILSFVINNPSLIFNVIKAGNLNQSKNYDDLRYSDELILFHNFYPLRISKLNELILTNDPLFYSGSTHCSLIPNGVSVYDSDKRKHILSDCKFNPNDKKTYYDKHLVTRNPNYYGLSKTENSIIESFGSITNHEPKKINTTVLICLIISIGIFLILVFFLIVFKKKQIR